MEKDKNLRNRSPDTKAHPTNANSKKGDLPLNTPKKSDILRGGLARFGHAQSDLSHKLMKIHSVKIASVYRSSESGNQMLGDRRYIYPNCGAWGCNTEINNVQINPWGAVYRNSIIGVEKISSGKIHINTPKAYKTNSWGRLGSREAADHLDSILKRSCCSGDLASKEGVEGRSAPSDLSKHRTQRAEAFYSGSRGTNIDGIDDSEGLQVGTDAAAAAVEIGKYHETGDIEAHE